MPTLRSIWAWGTLGLFVAAPALAEEAAAPFAITDERLKGADGPDPCSTDITLNKEGNGYRTEGLLHRERGKFWTFCPGARHKWKGVSTDVEGAIQRIDSDADDPLVFEIDKQRGYVYRQGKGTVVLADGTSVSLPVKSGHPAKNEAPAGASLETAFGTLKSVARRNRFPFVTLSKKGRRREVKKAAPSSEFVVLSFTGACSNRTACQPDAQWAKPIVAVADGVTLTRAGGDSFLRDGAGKTYKESRPNVTSASRRELGFEVPAGATDLVWVDGDHEIPLTSMLKRE